MPTDPLTGSRYPSSTDAPNAPDQIRNAVFDLADNTIPRFTSTALRDTAYSSWVAQGGSMANGLTCHVGTTRYVYLSGAWAPDVIGYQNKMMRAQRVATSPLTTGTTFTPFASNTSWTETDPWGMRSTGATFVAPWTGWYQINATLYFAVNATGGRGMQLNPATGVDIGNGSGVALRLAIVQAAPNNSTIVSGSHLTALTAGNTVQLEGYQNSGTTIDVENINISMAYLGPNT